MALVIRSSQYTRRELTPEEWQILFQAFENNRFRRNPSFLIIKALRDGRNSISKKWFQENRINWGSLIYSVNAKMEKRSLPYRLSPSTYGGSHLHLFTIVKPEFTPQTNAEKPA